MTVRRLDFGTLRFDAGKNRTPNGFLECDAVIARTGIQVYRRADGTERREYRPPEEVFKADALASAAKVPITFTPDTWNWHPQEKVTADNARQYTVGLTGPEAKADGDLVKTRAMVWDGDAIKAAESGDFAQLSCGYDCDLEMAPGKTPAGEKYDGVQRNIRINHVAMVRAARAGPEARLHLDADDNAVHDHNLSDPEKERSMAMVKRLICGVECEVSDVAAQLLNKQDSEIADERKKRDEEKAKAEKTHAEAVVALKKELDTTKADADANKLKAETTAKKLEESEKARKDSEDPKKLQTAIAQRVTLEHKAKGILGDDAKLSEKTDAEVKKDVVAKAMPTIKLDGKTDAYIEALFDRAVAEYEEEHPMAAARRPAGPPPKKQDGAVDSPAAELTEEELTADASFAAMQKTNRDASKPKAAK